MIYSLEGKKIWVAGHTGMVGSALIRRLENDPARQGFEIITVPRAQLDLTRQKATEDWLAQHKPDTIFIAAAKAGGIQANRTLPADFLYENLIIATNIIHAAYKTGVEKLLFLGSSCIYPRDAAQPITEDALLTGALEPTNEAYATAKIAGIKLCQSYRKQYGADFIAAMPTNLYGRHDNYHPEHAHVPAALIRRFHEAKINNAPSVTVWGTGTPLREFMDADDLADACVFLMQNYSAPEPINIGSGQEISIAAFANLIKEVIGYEGEIIFDSSLPDGTPRKRLDTSKLEQIGWRAQTDLRTGLKKMYGDFLKNGAQERT